MRTLPVRQARKKKSRKKLFKKRLSPRLSTLTAEAGPLGQAIRISPDLYAHVYKLRKYYTTKGKGRKKPERKLEPWDTTLRRHFNLPLRTGEAAPLREVWYLPSTGQTFSSLARAKGEAVKNGVKAGRAGRFEEPLLLREVP